MNGDDIQDPFESFDQLFEKYKELIPEIIKNNLISYNFPEPTPIQMQSIPIMLNVCSILLLNYTHLISSFFFFYLES